MSNYRSTSAQYVTNNSLYGQGWLIQDQQLTIDIKKAPVPTYAEVVKNMQVMESSYDYDLYKDFRRAEKLLKNQLVAKQFGLSDPSVKRDILTEEEIQRRKLDTKIPPKPFHVKEGEYKLPNHGMNIGSPVYETSNMQYGGLKPSSFELIEKYYPRNNQFSHQFDSGMYKFDGLNTSVNFSKTHKALDEY